MIYYRQCLLERGQTNQVSWIPEQFAKKNKYIKLKNNKESGCLVEEGKWEDGWKVIEVGIRMPEDIVLSNSQAYKHHRKNTDI